MRTAALIVAAILVQSCGDLRSFDEMPAQQRRTVGSELLTRACALSGDPHERGPLTRLRIDRGHDYYSYVVANSHEGELDMYVDEAAISACLATEGWSGELRELILERGTDQQVETLVQSAASPQSYCGLDHHRGDGAQRIVAACGRLGMR